MTALVLRSLERELLVWFRTWRGTVFTSILQPVLFLGAMGLGLGGLVDEGAGQVDGVGYLEFVTPGLLVASAMLASANGALWGVMANMKWMGQNHSMVATAMTPADVYGGQVLAAGVRGGATSAAFLLVAGALGGLASWWSPVALGVAVLVSALTFASLAAFSATREHDESFPLIMRLGVFPLFLFSGTFFPVSQLPDALEALAWLSPLWHAAEAARAATTGEVGAMVLLHVGILVGLLGAAIPVGMRTFANRLTP